MKQIAIGILASILFIGCQQSERPLPIKEGLLPSGIRLLTIDGCQYIKASEGFGGTSSVSIIHKANCPNHGDTVETK